MNIKSWSLPADPDIGIRWTVSFYLQHVKGLVKKKKTFLLSHSWNLLMLPSESIGFEFFKISGTIYRCIANISQLVAHVLINALNITAFLKYKYTQILNYASPLPVSIDAVEMYICEHLNLFLIKVHWFSKIQILNLS